MCVRISKCIACRCAYQNLWQLLPVSKRRRSRNVCLLEYPVGQSTQILSHTHSHTHTHMCMHSIFKRRWVECTSLSHYLFVYMWVGVCGERCLVTFRLLQLVVAATPQRCVCVTTLSWTFFVSLFTYRNPTEFTMDGATEARPGLGLCVCMLRGVSGGQPLKQKQQSFLHCSVQENLSGRWWVCATRLPLSFLKEEMLQKMCRTARNTAWNLSASTYDTHLLTKGQKKTPYMDEWWTLS